MGAKELWVRPPVGESYMKMEKYFILFHLFLWRSIMIVSRIINGVSIDIETKDANTLYFDESFARKIKCNSIDTLLEAIYQVEEKYIPLSMTWELTSQCNFFCKFCYVNTVQARRNFDKKKSIAQMKKNVDYLIEKGLLKCYLTGGEVLSLPYFADIYTYLKEKGVLVSVLTNLSLLTQKHVDLFLKLKPYKIVVSIYAMSHELFEKITERPGDVLDAVLKNISILKRNGIHVVCQTPVNIMTLPEIGDIANWCYWNNVPYNISKEIFDSYDGDDFQSMEVSDEIFEDLNNSINRISSPVYDNTNCRMKFGYKYHFDCIAGKYYFTYGSEDKIRPCFNYFEDEFGKFNVGEDIGRAFENMTAYINKYKCQRIPNCSGCIAVDICSECIYTQAMADQVASYMTLRCEENISRIKKICKVTSD